MPLLNETTLKSIAREGSHTLRKSIDSLLSEDRSFSGISRNYDIFLSHSYLDKETIVGLKLLLNSVGLSVYVDWIDDNQMSRNHVTPETADTLRRRMASSKALLYAFSKNSNHSKWMPWELGYFDGAKGRVAIVPISRQTLDHDFTGQEYLGLYPYLIQDNPPSNSLFIKDQDNTYRSLKKWLG